MLKSLLRDLQKCEIEGCEVYDLGIFGNNKLSFVEINPSTQYKAQSCTKNGGKVYIVEGTGFVIISERRLQYSPGDYFHIKHVASETPTFEASTPTICLQLTTF